MPTPERRLRSICDPEQLRAQLNESQQRMLRELECFGWELRFVRRPPFVQPIPVLFAADATGEVDFITLRFDGSLDEQSALDIRP
jgi:hypothetical protein